MDTIARQRLGQGPDTVLKVDSLVTRFGQGVIHDGVSFTVGRGEVAALIGGSGTRKSVLLKEAIGLLRPAGGTVSLLGTDVGNCDPQEMNALRRRFGMPLQDRALFSYLTVPVNV